MLIKGGPDIVPVTGGRCFLAFGLVLIKVASGTTTGSCMLSIFVVTRASVCCRIVILVRTGASFDCTLRTVLSLVPVVFPSNSFLCRSVKLSASSRLLRRFEGEIADVSNSSFSSCRSFTPICPIGNHPTNITNVAATYS